MPKNTSASIVLYVVLCLVPAVVASGAPAVKGPFGAAEWKQSAIAIRPGVPGKAPFWNAYTQRFIFAPAFNYPRVDGAAKYQYEIISLNDASIHRFESEVPYAPLSPVWAAVPVGNFDLRVTGISARGDSVGVAGTGKYFRAAPFDGPYHEPIMAYDQSALLALDKIMHKDYVEYWLTHRKPDPEYQFYRYSAKIFGSLVVGAVAHARLKAGTQDADRSTRVARIVADYLIGISFPAGAPLEHFPPTYHGSRIGKDAKSHMQLDNYMTIVATDSGHAFLDLYDHVKDQKYLDAAHRIARTFLKTQLASGTWHLYVNNQTGQPTSQYATIPTAVINYFDRLRKTYGMEGLEKSIERALAWIMENPVKTFHWLSQYEDVNSRAYAPYEKMSREQVCDLAIYLFKNQANRPKDLELAEDLIRFAEDQFLTWEQSEDLVVVKNTADDGKGRLTLRPPPPNIVEDPGWYSKNWMTPTVHEQFGFWMPSARNTGLMIETYWHAYTTTRKEVYLAKALSIANNFTRVQQVHDGDYPTFFTKYPMNFWINNSIYPAKVMMTLQEDLKKHR
jgi:hypothetical protein